MAFRTAYTLENVSNRAEPLFFRSAIHVVGVAVGRVYEPALFLPDE